MIESLANVIFESLRQFFSLIISSFERYLEPKENKYKFAVLLDTIFIVVVLFWGFASSHPSLFKLISPFPTNVARHNDGEVFGFAPFWTFDNLDNVDFSTLTTFAYFGITVNPDGSLVNDDPGYQTFVSDKATNTFTKAHSYGTKVVLTLTQMDNYSITALMDNEAGQEQTINSTLDLVKARKLDGVNIDFEYMGDPGDEYRAKFSTFIKNFTDKLHQEVPGSNLTVSVYASAIKDPKIYDIKTLGKVSDGIFMMAYDFAVSGSENAIPTSPLYGYKQGKYWYDVSTAVDDFLKNMPANKLILGLPWYGYNYPVYSPAVEAQTLPWYGGTAQMYGAATANITPANVSNLESGWDNLGKVGWKGYYDENSGTWRMLFLDDPKSLAIKYDFAKDKKLEGVGIWALGFDQGRKEMWDVLKDKFGTKIASKGITDKAYANTN